MIATCQGHDWSGILIFLFFADRIDFTPVAQKIHFWEMLNEVELWQRPAWTSF
jgi:hypothetical protein